MSRGAGATVPEATGLFGRVGVFVLRWPWVVIGFWIALAAVLSVTFPPLTEMASKRPVAILPPDAPVLVTTHQITEAFNQSGSENENVLLVVLTDENGLSPSDYVTYRALADTLRPDTRDIVMLQDFVHTPALREAVTSKDHKAWYLPMVLAGGVGTPELHEGYTRVADAVKQTVAGSTLTANLTGPAATGDDLTYIGIRDMHVIETAVVLMVLIILFVIYRNPLTMMLPLITIGVSVVTAQAIVSGVAQLGLGVSSQTITLMTTMMAGAGIDYAVFLISRYHDYLRLGLDSGHAVVSALASIGKVITGSAATVSITFLGMSLHPFGRLQNCRPGVGHFHCGGAPGRSDIPPGPARPHRTSWLDHAAPRSHPPLLAALGNTHCAPTGDASARQSYRADHSGLLRDDGPLQLRRQQNTAEVRRELCRICHAGPAFSVERHHS